MSVFIDCVFCIINLYFFSNFRRYHNSKSSDNFSYPSCSAVGPLSSVKDLVGRRTTQNNNSSDRKIWVKEILQTSDLTRTQEATKETTIYKHHKTCLKEFCFL